MILFNRFISKLDKIRIILVNQLHISRKIKYEVVSDRLLQSSLFDKESIVDSNASKNLVVSLTTYNIRIHQVHLVIESIAKQSLKPTHLILWLDEKEFSEETIPEILKRQRERGLEIRFCQDYKSYKKLIPTLELYPNDDIVTIDDDILYPYYFLERLVKESRTYPKTVISYRAHKVSYSATGGLLPYKSWDRCTRNEEASFDIFPTGIGGILYPNGSLHEDCNDYELASRLAPKGDDIWFKAMTLRNGYKSKIVSGKIDFKYDFFEIPSGIELGLYVSNVIEGGYDEQIKSVFDKYNLTLS